jgi:hypothetical protein
VALTWRRNGTFERETKNRAGTEELSRETRARDLIQGAAETGRQALSGGEGIESLPREHLERRLPNTAGGATRCSGEQIGRDRKQADALARVSRHE